MPSPFTPEEMSVAPAGSHGSIRETPPGKVRLLPDAVASQVAAGEVIERPASVLKELLENSLDAGADRIEVEFNRGGSLLVRVSDNGCGMDRDDALLSLERHATSKIRTAGDLVRVGTFGFRGEALPSMASVSRFRLATRPAAAHSATEILVEGGKLLEVRESGEPPGTTIEVKNLFFNLPARRKFLRTELTESSHLLHQFETSALAHPRVAFVLRKDGRIIHQCGATEDLRVRVRDLLGEEFLGHLLEAPPWQEEDIRVYGLLGRPGSARVDRQQQFIFLNRRPVHDAAIARGFRDALAGGGESRLQPIGIIFLEMDPEAFDCNVHPAKREVRFHRPECVREAIAGFARRAWQPQAPAQTALSSPPPTLPPDGPNDRPPAGFHSPGAPRETRPLPGLTDQNLAPASPRSSSPPESRPPVWNPAPSDESSPPQESPISPSTPDFPPSPATPAAEVAATIDSPTSQHDFVFRGTLGQRYWLLENPDGLVLLDLRHALERITYEDLVRQRGARGMPGQRLLAPVTTQVSPADYAWVAENASLLRKAGLEAEPFGGGVIKIEAVPAGLDDWDPPALLIRLLDEIRSGSRQAAQRFLLDQVAVVLSSIRSARVDAHRLAGDRPADFLRRLFACDLPYAAPGGQPTLIQFSWSELEKKFR